MRRASWLLVLVSLVLANACSGGSGGGGIGALGLPDMTPTEIVAPIATPPPTLAPSPAPIPAAELPIIDLHFHPDPAWGGEALDRLFDQLNVRAGGNGAAGADAVAISEAAKHPGRIIPFSGGQTVRTLIDRYGSRVWTLEAEEARRYLEELETSLRDELYKGIGEVHVNNWNSNIIGSPRYRYPADSALVQQLFELASTHDVPLSVHMDGEPDSVAQMERLLAGNRDGLLIWAHTGHYADPATLRRLLEAHPNLYCELSYRTAISAGRRAPAMDDNGRLRPEWLALLEAFPDRFVIGTDIGFASPPAYAAHIATWRGILLQLSPETAVKLAYLNAERLVKVSP
ncbi:MAG: amidohydrolase family protein [Dehalococcoidia bacterium]|nr:amidohydrolase family protein [Dehalococcoidia bacterium]